MRDLFKYSQFIVILLLTVPGCKENSPKSEPDPPHLIGVWEVIGDTMIVWQGNSKEGSDYNSIKPVHIKFVYASPHPDKPDIPRVRFTLVDSSITSTDYNNLDVHGIYYQLSVPPSFDLISFHYKRRGFSSTPVSYSYDSEHEVYCENNSSINQLAFEFYNRGSLERKYEFNTEGVGEAIRQIACN